MVRRRKRRAGVLNPRDSQAKAERADLSALEPLGTSGSTSEGAGIGLMGCRTLLNTRSPRRSRARSRHR
ncbi:MAG: hypothetical protein MZV63_19505 [Marinilabiliales bacterium]|nr:hypothetical protein [Marinilabiliales bacterium]